MRISRMCSAIANSPSASHCRTRARYWRIVSVSLSRSNRSRSSALSDSFTGFGRDHGGSAEIVDLLGDGQGVVQFLFRVDLELVRDTHVGSALDHLGVDDVG